MPVNLSREYEKLVDSGGGTVGESRTGLGNVALKGAGEKADIAGTGDGRYIFPDFLPAPDCFITLARALELFKTRPLSKVRQRFGSGVGRVEKQRLECSWSDKGRVMRGLAEKFGGDPDVILTDGIKLNVDGGWVLMLPDPDNPLFYVYAETGDGSSGASNGSPGSESHEVVKEYTSLVASLISGENGAG